jgi:threonine dehydratase
MALVVRHLRVVVEPAGAAGLAGVLASDAFRGARVGVLLTGSNVSGELLSRVLG